MAYSKIPKEHRAGYRARSEPVLVKVRRAQYLTIEGAGGPGTPSFQRRLDALYSVAIAIQEKAKLRGKPYMLGWLEAQWWVEGDGEFDPGRPQEWRYSLMILTPKFITDTERKDAMEELFQRGKQGEVLEVGLRDLAEGVCVQALHIGRFETGRATIAKMLELARVNRLAPRLRHHEIYLSDPRRQAAEKLRTILRQPVG